MADHERWVPAKEMAASLRLTPRRMGQLAETELADGTPFPVKGEGRDRVFAWDAGFEWYLRYREETAVRRAMPQTDPLADAERRKAVAGAAMMEMKVARGRGELVPTELFRQELRAAFSRVATRLRAIPGEFSDRMLGLSQKAVAVKRLQDLVDTLLAELSAPAADDDDSAAAA